ncbi:MAG: 16S rRNA processing protein RimM [Flavobacteriaceae bacterium]|nr:16S rRNA processing protein RimM [Flavobacteriaceae bacterium]
MKDKNLFKLGKILKPFSYKGEVSVYSTINLRKYSFDLIHLKINSSIVPFKIKSLKNQKTNIYRISFDSIDSENKAEKLRNVEIYCEKNQLFEEDYNASEKKQLIGYKLIDINKKHIGEIVNIINNYQQDLIQVIYIEKKLLIPYVDEMIIQINHDEKVIEMELPNGILDL